MSEMIEQNNPSGIEIAIIGMAGRFPKARNIREFWNNLKNGIETISFFSDEELKASGMGVDPVDPELANAPNYVKCNGGILEDKELFDAFFFDYTPKEAELMDPQMRIFHECTWEALEDAGYNPYSYPGLIGIYAGAAANIGWEGLSFLSGKRQEIGEFAAKILTSKDFLSTRLAYKLNLRGPALTVQTACSTSLVAVHMACQALLDGECDIALAGGVKIAFQHNVGYMFREGMIQSPDGHCRAFDARAKGTTSGEGAGIVVLKPLDRALEDRDHIHALIKGTAINNDGIIKAGYTAPSREGQTEVIRTALQVAEVEPETITYIETHGTGTAIGDPIEIEALKQAYATDKTGFCAIGSVKTNIGHLDAAAGVAGLIKTVLTLKHKLIPPSLHYEKPNPKIDFDNSPFYVNAQLKEWKYQEGPLRAGVSSFGIGGTNAHVILEEWSDRPTPPLHPDLESRPYQLILLSAKTETALDKMTKNLAGHLQENPHVNLADAAYTLQVGRPALQHRKMLVCSERNQAVDALTSNNPDMVQTFYSKIENRPVIFMFPGQGAQYVNMGYDLYQNEPLFREEMNRCFEILQPLMDVDIKEILYPQDSPLERGGREADGVCNSDKINQTEIAQPLLVAFEYTLTTLLLKWGIQPYAMIGHSIGEYTAAVFSGVFSLQDALTLAVWRGKLMQQMPGGAMLSIPLSPEDIKPLLTDKELALAAVNAPARCVVSGTHQAIDSLARQLKEKGLQYRKLHTSHAFHSPMMEPVLEKFTAKVKEIQLNKPQIPYISNVTGKWITVCEALDPGYWAAHLRKTVRFADGLSELLKKENTIFLEIGPGKTLSTLLRDHPQKSSQHLAVNLVRHPDEKMSDHYYMLNKIGQLWLYGNPIDWTEFYMQEERLRISLPTYPFESQRYWIDTASLPVKQESPGREPGKRQKKDISHWFYIPSWKRTGAVDFAKGKELIFSKVLIFSDETGLGAELGEQLQQAGKTVLMVKPGTGFARESDSLYVIDPQKIADYHALFEDLKSTDRVPDSIIHMWSLSRSQPGETGPENFKQAQYLGFYSQVYMVQAIKKQKLSLENNFRIIVVSNHLQEVSGEEVLSPEKATIMGPAKVIPQEFPNMTYRCIDVVLPAPGTWQNQQLIRQLLSEISRESRSTVVAYRLGRRWIQLYEPLPWNKEKLKQSTILREKGVYLITGGLGGIGLILGKYLARTLQARLILTRRSPFPGRQEWEKWLSDHDEKDTVSLKIRALQEIEAAGGEVLVYAADTADYLQMQQVLDRSQKRFGQVNGVFHAAGITGKKSNQCPVELITSQDVEEQFNPKVQGLLVLEKLCKDKNLDFCILMSSLSTVLGGLGFTAYAAANQFMDTFVQKQAQRSPRQWLTVNWDGWKLPQAAESQEENKGGELAILPEEGELALQGILSPHGENQMLVSTSDLQQRIQQWIQLEARPGDNPDLKKETGSTTARPNLTTPFEAPRDQLEQAIAAIWENFLGFEKLGIHDDFFELGGDSLKMMGVASKIHLEMEVEIPLSEFFNTPTIKGLAGYIAASAKSQRCVPLTPAENKSFYPLSSAQLRLYVIHQMDESSTGYNLTQPVLLEGNIEKEKLTTTIYGLIKRHEILRTSICMVENEPMQKIHDDVEFAVEYYECRNREDDGDEVRDILRYFVRPFDLKSPPFFRVGLIKMAEEKHVLVLDFHHLVTDGVSTIIFINDFMALYAEKELPPLKFQYKDYSQWENSREIQTNLEAQEAYWLKQFAGELPVLNIPTDFSRPKQRDFQGEDIIFDLGEELKKVLNQLAKETQTTVYMILLSALTILLAKYSRQEDIIVGTPILGRRHSGLENIMGVFVNLLAMRNQPRGNITYREFLQQVKETTLNAYENQDYPFEKLAKKLGQQGSLNRNPLFDIIFQLNPDDISADKDVTRDTGLTVKPFLLKEKRCVFDLVLFAYETAAGIKLALRYSTALFERSRCEKMVEHFIEILEQVARDNDIQLLDISISHRLLQTRSTALEEARNSQEDFAF